MIAITLLVYCIFGIEVLNNGVTDELGEKSGVVCVRVLSQGHSTEIEENLDSLSLDQDLNPGPPS